ncbi:MarR family transcriptional regulator [Xylophilus rhododendri]|uniref:MarR family transcriptional regulator n=1 Tax=Xylophilus rhododendri TaxID=2697032 RepID=A0A857J2J4_9BURK|nr:MarR family winged helix-turn-helix transcriptional regulator [Xylophilus rhododendri]QHI97138.1 MarR family transcriptional regulator [Xylophilus rhododendri]
MTSAEPSAADTGPYSPQGCTNAKLRQLTRRVGQHFDAEVAQSGLKTTQYSLLTTIESHAAIRSVDLAALLHMTASTLSRNLHVLVDAGWVELGDGPDARSRLVRITEAGKAQRRAARVHWRRAQQSLVALLGAERVAALHALIDEALPLLAPAPDENLHEH